MNPQTALALQYGARTTGRAASSFINEPIIGTFTLKKAMIWFVILVLIYLVYYFFIRKSEKDRARQLADDAIDGLSLNHSNLTLTDNDINMIAMQLYNAMAPVGTDDNAIFSALNRIETRDDLLAVIKRFGIREYSLFGSPSGISWLWGVSNLDLAGWLKAELSGQSLERVREIFSNFNVLF